jgi:hypothetical protein
MSFDLTIRDAPVAVSFECKALRSIQGKHKYLENNGNGHSDYREDDAACAAGRSSSCIALLRVESCCSFEKPAELRWIEIIDDLGHSHGTISPYDKIRITGRQPEGDRCSRHATQSSDDVIDQSSKLL